MKPPGAKFDDDQIIEALQATRCNLAEATRFLIRKWNLPCHRDYVASVTRKRRRLREWVREFREAAADRAEANIFRQVENGDLKASVLVVRTLGKDRGWVPKKEREGRIDADALIKAIRRGRERALAKQRLVAIPPEGTGGIEECYEDEHSFDTGEGK